MLCLGFNPIVSFLFDCLESISFLTIVTSSHLKIGVERYFLVQLFLGPLTLFQQESSQLFISLLIT